MRTWRQGVVGRVKLPDSSVLYVKCLKYPLALFYDGFDPETQAFGTELLLAFVELGALRLIDRIGLSPLSAKDRRLGDRLNVRHVAGAVGIEEIAFSHEAGDVRLLNPCRPSTIEEIQERLRVGRS